VGGTLATAAVVFTIVAGTGGGWSGALLAQPAAWAVPLTFAVMITVSRVTASRVPADAGRVMVRLHAPEALAEELRGPVRSSTATDRSAHEPDRRTTTPAHPAI